MAISGFGTSTAGSPPVQDTQTLVSLLGSLMPLLLRIQSQGLQSQGPGQAPQFDQAGMMTTNPMVDHQAAVSLIEDITADSLRRLSAYLEAHASRHTGLEGCVPIVTQAAHCFATRDYAQAFDLTLQAYRFITMLQMANPQIPPIRGTDTFATSASATPGVVH